jgi:hypothetical protein
VICGRRTGFVLFWLTKGRHQFDFLRFNNMYSIEWMFLEILAFVRKYQQTVYKIKVQGRSKLHSLADALFYWSIPLFYSNKGNRRPFNGCKMPHTRRV